MALVAFLSRDAGTRRPIPIDLVGLPPCQLHPLTLPFTMNSTLTRTLTVP